MEFDIAAVLGRSPDILPTMAVLKGPIMNRYPTKVMCLVAGMIGLLAMAGCATAPGSPEGKADIRQDAATALNKAQTSDPTLVNVFNASAGYAVFPSIGKGAAGVGGAYGKGVLYQAGVAVGYCDLSQASIGLQLGGQSYTEIVCFKTPLAVDTFKQGNLRFDAQATAVALKSGAGADAKFANGVAVFTMDEAGLMYEASVGGQQFSYQAK
jgi:lipid-binding SYLF domain-containing protein